MSTPPRPACTVVLCAPSPDGLRVLLLQRSRANPFLPGAWVFPGGRVDEADGLVSDAHLHGGQAALERLGLPPREGRAMLVAGARETYEETGIWLGGAPPPPEARAALLAGELGFGDLLERYRCTLDLDRLQVVSWWVTPREESRRYDTRFLFATVPSLRAEPDDHEIVATCWIHPKEAARASFTSLPMAPPTWWVLRELADCDSPDDGVAKLLGYPHQPIEPIRVCADPFEVVLPGHPDHPAPPIEGVPPRIAVVGDRWRALDLARAMDLGTAP